MVSAPKKAGPAPVLARPPSWTAFRKGCVVFSFAIGGAMILRPMMGPMSEHTIQLYIEGGQNLIIWTIIAVMSAGSLERGGAWWAQIRGLRK